MKHKLSDEELEHLLTEVESLRKLAQSQLSKRKAMELLDYINEIKSRCIKSGRKSSKKS